MTALYVMRKPTVRKVRGALRWAGARGDAVVHMLDVGVSFARRHADIGFETAVGMVNQTAAGYFRVADRGNDIEVFVRGIEAPPKEYFIFVHLDRACIREIVEAFGLEQV